MGMRFLLCKGQYTIVYLSEDRQYVVVKPQGGYYREINPKTGRVDYIQALDLYIVRLDSTPLQP